MASSHYFEVVQLENGDFALQSSEDSSKHLVKISFGEDAKAFLAKDDATVARAMIKAAILAVEELRDKSIERETEERSSQTLH